MKLVITVDVEEEGLFSGRYPRVPAGVENVGQLRRLEFITSEFGLPLTLLVTYRAAVDPACRKVLEFWRDNLGAEIGAHLHHWNTPPFADLVHPEPIRSEQLPRPLLGAKLDTLLAALVNHLGVAPRAFRMGRFDLGKTVLELLPEHGLSVDSSMVPLQKLVGGPDHFLAPADPFRSVCTTTGGEDSSVLEVPLTIVPVLRTTPGAVYKLASKMPSGMCNAVFTGFRYFAVAGVQPAWFSLQSMQWAVRLHRSRRGRVLTMFLHSSELLPGATPSFRTEKAVDRLVRKIRSFLTWLVRIEPIEGVTLSELL